MMCADRSQSVAFSEPAPAPTVDATQQIRLSVFAGVVPGWGDPACVCPRAALSLTFTLLARQFHQMPRFVDEE
jgi:hypothetical protein